MVSNLIYKNKKARICWRDYREGEGGGGLELEPPPIHLLPPRLTFEYIHTYGMNEIDFVTDVGMPIPQQYRSVIRLGPIDLRYQSAS